ARKEFIGTVEVLRPPSFELHLSVAIVRVGQLGALERAVDLLEQGIRRLFEAANTTKPVTRSRRGVPANRRKAKSRKEGPGASESSNAFGASPAAGRPWASWWPRSVPRRSGHERLPATNVRE